MSDYANRKTRVSFGKFKGKTVSELIARKEFEFLLDGHHNVPDFILENKLLLIVIEGKEKGEAPPKPIISSCGAPNNMSRWAQYADDDDELEYAYGYC